jgi:hypothetical protein
MRGDFYLQETIIRLIEPRGSEAFQPERQPFAARMAPGSRCTKAAFLTSSDSPCPGLASVRPGDPLEMGMR